MTLSKNSYSSRGELDTALPLSSLLLKLSVSFKHLRYFIISETHGQVIYFGEYLLHQIMDENSLSERVKRLLEHDDMLNLNYGKIIVGFDSDYQLLPSVFVPAIPTGELFTQICGETTIQFVLPTALEKVIRDHFKDVEIMHLNSTYLRLPILSNEILTNALYVNVGEEQLDVISFDSSANLRCMNRYPFHTVADFIYFVLLCADELFIDRETTELILCGEVSEASAIFEICDRYFSKVSFLNSGSVLQFTNAFHDYPMHLHFKLYNLGA